MIDNISNKENKSFYSLSTHFEHFFEFI